MATKRRKIKQTDQKISDENALHPKITSESKKLVELFNRLQLDEMSTAKAVGKLKEIFETSDQDNFFDHVVFMLQIPLANGTSKEKPNKFDEKIMQVVSRFAAASLEENPEQNDSAVVDLPWILRKLFEWLLDHHQAQSSCARLRICMMINSLLKNLGLQAEIDEVLYQKIHDNMMERLQDKVAEIRAQAVTALQRLQDPTDDNCPVIRAYLYHLRFDPSALVRRTVIKVIGASKLILQHIFDRTRDVDDLVRKAAYKYIAEKVAIKVFSISKREEILRRGLKDSSQGVQNVVAKELVPAWLQNCNGNVVELLHAIDVGNSDGKTAAEICKATFSGVPYDQLVESFKYIDPKLKVVPLNKLTPETVTYWRSLVAYLHSEIEMGCSVESAEAHLEKILPELTHFCAYVRDYVVNYMGKVPKQDEGDDDVDEEEIEAYEVAGFYVTKQLIEMTAYFDLADEVGRQNLSRLCKDLLANRHLDAEFVEPVMKMFNTVEKNVDTRIQGIAEIISDLRDPLISSQSQRRLDEQRQVLQQRQEQQPQRLNETIEEMTEREQEEERRKLETEARKNEEALRKKRVNLAKLRLRMNIVKDEMDSAVIAQEFVKAQELKLEFDTISEEAKNLLADIEAATAVTLTTPMEPKKVQPVVDKQPEPQPETSSQSQPQTQTQNLKDAPEMILKSLTMLSDLMRSQDIGNLNATLQSLLDEFITPSIRDLNYEIREAAVKAMGCACLRSLQAAKRHLLLIVSMAHLDVPLVRLRALRVVVDLLMWHGLAAFISENNEDDCDDAMSSVSQEANTQGTQLTQAELNTQGGNSVVTVLCNLLDDPDSDIRTLVTEGLCKLMLCGSISSHKLITRFVLMWCNPVNDTNLKLKAMLGKFFPLYASLSRANQDTIEESFLPTLKTLMEAPETSPLALVNLDDIGMFLIQLTRPQQLQTTCRILEEENSVHDSIAFTISNFIISTPDSFYLKSFVKFLLNLQISSGNFSQLRELKELCNQMTEKVSEKLDKQTLKSLEKYSTRLDDLIKLDPEARDKTVVEQTEEANEGGRRESVASLATSEQSTFSQTMRKRTLFSQTQNNLLDASTMEDTPNRENLKSKHGVTMSDTLFSPGLYSTKASSATQQPEAIQAALNGVTKRGAPPESSDSEIEFRRPAKVSRSEEVNNMENEEIVSGNLHHRKRDLNLHEKERESDNQLNDSASDTEVNFRSPKKIRKSVEQSKVKISIEELPVIETRNDEQREKKTKDLEEQTEKKKKDTEKKKEDSDKETEKKKKGTEKETEKKKKDTEKKKKDIEKETEKKKKDTEKETEKKKKDTEKKIKDKKQIKQNTQADSSSGEFLTPEVKKTSGRPKRTLIEKTEASQRAKNPLKETLLDLEQSFGKRATRSSPRVVLSPSGGEEMMTSGRPKRTPRPTAKLRETSSAVSRRSSAKRESLGTPDTSVQSNSGRPKRILIDTSSTSSRRSETSRRFTLKSQTAAQVPSPPKRRKK